MLAAFGSLGITEVLIIGGGVGLLYVVARILSRIWTSGPH